MKCHLRKNLGQNFQKDLYEIFDPGICMSEGCSEVRPISQSELSTTVYRCEKLDLDKEKLNLLAEKNTFSQYISEINKNNPRLFRDQLINTIYEKIKEVSVDSDISIPKKSEVAYKFHKWFLNDAINKHSKLFHFSNKEDARKLIEEMCKDGYIHPISKNSIEDNLRICLNTYFSTPNELRELVGAPKIYEGNKKFKTKDEARNAIKNFILKNPTKRTTPKIEKEFGISFYSYFGSISEAFEYAQIEHPHRRRNPKEKEDVKIKVLGTIRENPRITRAKLEKKYHTDIRGLGIKDMKDAYVKAEAKDESILLRMCIVEDVLSYSNNSGFKTHGYVPYNIKAKSIVNKMKTIGVYTNPYKVGIELRSFFDKIETNYSYRDGRYKIRKLSSRVIDNMLSHCKNQYVAAELSKNANKFPNLCTKLNILECSMQ